MLVIVIFDKYPGTNLWKRGSCCLHQTEPTSLGEHSVPPYLALRILMGWIAEMTRSGDRESQTQRLQKGSVMMRDLRLRPVCGESVDHCGFASCVCSSPGISVHPIDLGFPLWRERDSRHRRGKCPDGLRWPKAGLCCAVLCCVLYEVLRNQRRPLLNASKCFPRWLPATGPLQRRDAGLRPRLFVFASFLCLFYNRNAQWRSQPCVHPPPLPDGPSLGTCSRESMCVKHVPFQGDSFWEPTNVLWACPGTFSPKPHRAGAICLIMVRNRGRMGQRRRASELEMKFSRQF